MAKSPAKSPAELLAPDRPLTLANVTDGAEGLVIADLARAVAAGKNAPATSALVVCRDGSRMAALARSLSFFAPEIEAMQFPAWDCVPYDRVSPHATIVAQRMTALSRLARVKGRDKPAVLLTTVNAVLQRVPSKDQIAQAGAVGRARQRAGDGGRDPLAGAERLPAQRDGARARRIRGARRHPRPVRAGHGAAGAARLLRRHAGKHPQLRSRDAAHRDGDARARPRAGRRVPAHHRHDPQIPHRLCRRLRRGEPRRRALRGGHRGPPPSRHGALAAAVPRPHGHAVRLSCRARR